MTDLRLRELLEERVADTTTVDLASEAWERASAVRRRRRAVAGAAVAVVAIVGVTTVVVSGRGDEQPPPATNTTETTAPGPKAERAGRYGGVPVWWAPTTADEADLPLLSDSALPGRIDLEAPGGPLPAGMRAVGLFQLWGEEPGDVVVVGTDGASYSLDIDRLEPWSVDGEVRPPVTQESLSPDGRYAFFAQDRSLEVYDFEVATWTTITGGFASGGAEWSADGSSIRVQNPLYSSIYYDLYAPDGRHVGNSRESTDIVSGPNKSDETYGPTEWGSAGAGARGVHLAGPVAGPDGPYSTVDAVAVADPTWRLRQRDTLLAMPPEPGGGRWLQCCPPVGWLNSGTVLFESRHEDARVLAWRVGTPDMWRVSDIRGWTPGEESYVASFADLRR